MLYSVLAWDIWTELKWFLGLGFEPFGAQRWAAYEPR